jgi:hypothetical protein
MWFATDPAIGKRTRRQCVGPTLSVLMGSWHLGSRSTEFLPTARLVQFHPWTIGKCGLALHDSYVVYRNSNSSLYCVERLNAVVDRPRLDVEVWFFERVVDGANGYLISPNSSEALAAPMRRLAVNPAIRHQMGHPAAELIALYRRDCRAAEFKNAEGICSSDRRGWPS